MVCDEYGFNQRKDLLQLIADPGLKMSDSVRSLIQKMLAPEAERITIDQILKDPWMTSADTTEDNPSSGMAVVFGDIVSLSSTKQVICEDGDWVCHEVATKRTYLITKELWEMGHTDGHGAVGVPTQDLTEEQKLVMTEWETADKNGMLLYQTPGNVKEMLIMKPAGIAALCAKWPQDSSLRGSAMHHGETISCSTDLLPDNQDVFQYLTELMAEDSSSYLERKQYSRCGIFARPATRQDRKKGVQCTRGAHSDPLLDDEQVFPYIAPIHFGQGRDFITCTIREGDAFCYIPEARAIYTVVNKGLAANFSPIEASGSE